MSETRRPGAPTVAAQIDACLAAPPTRRRSKRGANPLRRAPTGQPMRWLPSRCARPRQDGYHPQGGYHPTMRLSSRSCALSTTSIKRGAILSGLAGAVRARSSMRLARSGPGRVSPCLSKACLNGSARSIGNGWPRRRLQTPCKTFADSAQPDGGDGRQPSAPPAGRLCL